MLFFVSLSEKKYHFKIISRFQIKSFESKLFNENQAQQSPVGLLFYLKPLIFQYHVKDSWSYNITVE